MVSRRLFISGIGATIGTPLFSAPVKSMLGSSEMSLSEDSISPNYTAEDYVQEGLISMWDGIENAGWGEHDDNPSKFVDLISQHNMSFLGGTDRITLEDGIMMNPNRTSDNIARARTSYTFSLQQDADKTISICASVDSDNYDSTKPMMFVCGTNSGIGAQDRILYARRNGSTAWQSLGIGYTTGIPFVITIVSSKTGVSVFANGVKIGTNIGNITYLSVSGWMQIGSYNATMPSCSTIHNIALYARSLEDKEVQYNYQVSKTRFNIP